MLDGNKVMIPDCCEDCQFHLIADNEHPDESRHCFLFDKNFNVDELFDEESHHKLRPTWCDVTRVDIIEGWLNSLLG
jgi:hypothetical protein